MSCQWQRCDNRTAAECQIHSPFHSLTKNTKQEWNNPVEIKVHFILFHSYHLYKNKSSQILNSTFIPSRIINHFKSEWTSLTSENERSKAVGIRKRDVAITTIIIIINNNSLVILEVFLEQPNLNGVLLNLAQHPVLLTVLRASQRKYFLNFQMPNSCAFSCVIKNDLWSN